MKEFEKTSLKYAFTPQKSKEYFIHRYYKNPFYTYEFLGIFENSTLLCVFITRKITLNHAKCIRIVDFLGDFTENIYALFQDLLSKYDYEYIDLLCHVPDFSKLTNMGFIQKDKEVITNYFEPYIKENQEVYFAFKSEKSNYAFFKGDSDQDRINTIKPKEF